MTLPVDISRLAQALRTQMETLRALLEHANRDEYNFHLTLAGHIRSMLCDAKWPTLIALAGELSLSLKVWGPYPPEAMNMRPPNFAMNPLTVSTQPAILSYEMTLREFLDAPIGAVSIPDTQTGNMRATWYTPKDLIKWSANKEGPAHFNPKPHPTFQAIASSLEVIGEVTMFGPDAEIVITENDNLPIRMALLQIAQATLVLSEFVLEAYSNSQNKAE